MALLELDNVQASYGSVKALHGISLAVESGQVVALLGANGAGKTTTLRAICGTVRRWGGIRFENTDLTRRSTEQVAGLGIAHVPEGRGTMGRFTVQENLELGAYSRGRRELRANLERAFNYFPVLAERRAQEAGTLSGGEQQMLAVARALMSQPRLLLLDEPSLGLAPQVVGRIFDIVRTINREQKTSFLIVEQNATLALEVADHAYVLETGRIAIDGPSAKLQQDESVRRSYLGY
ncbi:MAG TPA: ABC transporter ATP-binding protein [Candidatus Dormibacteraeota bacterium]